MPAPIPATPLLPRSAFVPIDGATRALLDPRAEVGVSIGPGATGRDVRDIQVMLQRTTGWTGRADHDFGPRTEGAVREFQQRSGMPSTGRVDADTMRELLAQFQLRSGLPQTGRIDHETQAALRNPDPPRATAAQAPRVGEVEAAPAPGQARAGHDAASTQRRLEQALERRHAALREGRDLTDGERVRELAATLRPAAPAEAAPAAPAEVSEFQRRRQDAMELTPGEAAREAALAEAQRQPTPGDLLRRASADRGRLGQVEAEIRRIQSEGMGHGAMSDAPMSIDQLRDLARLQRERAGLTEQLRGNPEGARFRELEQAQDDLRRAQQAAGRAGGRTNRVAPEAQRRIEQAQARLAALGAELGFNP
jgi:peptidoglycan hydrolase-like protein with peptidoglycan-binding domain